MNVDAEEVSLAFGQEGQRPQWRKWLKKLRNNGYNVDLDDKADLKSRFQSLDGTYELAVIRQRSRCKTRSDVFEQNVHQVRHLIR